MTERDEVLDPLADWLGRAYASAWRRRLGQAWGVSVLDPAAIADALRDPERGAAYLERAEEESSRGPLDALRALAQRGAKARLGALRADLLLGGADAPDASLYAALHSGGLLLAPSAHADPSPLEELAPDDGGWSTREVALAPSLIALLPEPDDAPIALRPIDAAIEPELGATRALALNLIHLVDATATQPIALTKSGRPNRRSFSKLVPELMRPGASADRIHFDGPEDASALDYFTFLMALLVELGLAAIDADSMLLGEPRAAQAFFGEPIELRAAAIARAAVRLSLWSERDVGIEGLSDDDRWSLTQASGAELRGARGYALGVVKRARPGHWVALDPLAALCCELDRGYLDRVVEPGQGASFVSGFIERTLYWCGLVELGRAPSGERAVRWSDRGRALYMGEPMPSEPDGADSLVVTPSLDVTAFLQGAPAPIIQALYDVGRRTELADRAATFRLDSASVQRGYARGWDAERLIALLGRASSAPLPESVAFQLKDWHRSWGRITLFASAWLVRHEDADALDLFTNELLHALREREVVAERVSAETAIVAVARIDDEIVLDIARRRGAEVIEYADDHPTPTLSYRAPLGFEFEPLRADLEAVRALEEIGQEIESPSEERRAIEVDPARAADHFGPDDPLGALIGFLDAHTRGGLPPEARLRARAALAEPRPRAELLTHTFVVRFGDEATAALVEASEHARELGAIALGRNAFAFPRSERDALSGWLDDIGIAATETS